MRVAVVAPTTIPSKKANTLQVMKMTQAISSIGHSVHLIIPDSTHSSDEAKRSWDFLADQYGLQAKFPIDWLSARASLRKYDFAWKAVRWARHWGADVIYTRLPQAAALAANRNMNTIFEIHDLPQGTFGPKLLRLFLRGSDAEKLVVISKALADDLQRESYLLPNSQILEILPDGVDLWRFEGLPAPDESREILAPILESQHLAAGSTFSTEQITIGYTGHLYPGRGVNLILEFAARIPGANFLIVGGEQSDVHKLQEQVKNRQLDNVTLTGFVPNTDLPQYQAACDVLLMPYQSKVAASSGGDIGRYLSPMKLFEYLACGRAICSSNLPVLQEILSNENAVLLPPDEVDAWVAAIQDLIDNPNLRRDLGEKARKTAQKYSWKARAEKIFNDIEVSKVI